MDDLREIADILGLIYQVRIQNFHVFCKKQVTKNCHTI